MEGCGREERGKRKVRDECKDRKMCRETVLGRERTELLGEDERTEKQRNKERDGGEKR